MRCKVTLAVAVALCWGTTAYADYWVETFDNGPTGGFDQVWTAHDWAAASGLGSAQSFTISPATGGLDNSYYARFGADRGPLGPGFEIIESEDTGFLPPEAAVQFASVDAVTFDDNGGHLYVQMRFNAARVSARNIAFIATNMQVGTVPGDLSNEQFYFLDLEPDPDQDPPEGIEWEADVGKFDPVNVPDDPINSNGFAGSNADSPRPDGLGGQLYTNEYILGFWVIPNADQYTSRPDIPAGATLLFGDIRQTDGTVIAQSSDDYASGVSEDWDDTGNQLPPGPVGVGFYNDGANVFSTYEDVTIDEIMATTYYDGDFDADGDVDGDDFLIWQAGFGTTTYASPRNGDADWDGDVDGDDFLKWQSNFGTRAAPGAASVAGVPEPSSLLLLLLGGLSLVSARRRS